MRPASSAIAAFDAPPGPRLVVGPGASDRIGEIAASLGLRRVLVVTDEGIVAAGHLDRVRGRLEAVGVAVAVYDRVRENPSGADAEACTRAAATHAADGLLGLGGGSALDTAKGCSLLLTNGGRMRDWRGHASPPKPLLPLIAVPTTTGTGSECQSYALIADDESHVKIACGAPGLLPRAAVLDPALAATQPRRVTACTGLDALVHAVETAVTRTRNPLSLLFAREAFALIDAHFERSLAHGDDLAARAAMQLGAAWAGTAIERSMLGAAHAAANPLTARCGLVHGHAVAVMLPAVVRYNAEDPAIAEEYARLAIHARLAPADASPAAAVAGLRVRLRDLLRAAQAPADLVACGFIPDDIPAMAAEAAQQWTGTHNPRPVDAQAFERIYRESLRAEGD